MKKRWSAVLLALALIAALLPAPARAADSLAGERLTGADRKVYDCLKAEIVKIAQGERTDTGIRVPNLDELSWTLDELGVSGASQGRIIEKMDEKFAQTVHVERIYDSLTSDCPFEMFWRSNRYTWDYARSRDGNRVYIENLVIRLDVTPSYRGNGVNSTSADKITRAVKVMENAQAIVDKYRDLSDYGKLSAYREEICRLVSYDLRAAGQHGAYGDPWQLIYVFDNDPATNVVCEGYAKAFKYLCDLSEFDGDVECLTVSGTMGRGNHMWNVVRMGNGKNYLADVTNCDTGMAGEGDRLFLVGGSGSGRSYTVSEGVSRAVYTYGENQEGLFGAGSLVLSAVDYKDEGDTSLSRPKPERPAFSDVPEGEYYAQAVAWAVAGEITNGTSDTTFSPDQNCTEAEILTFLWRAAGKPMVGISTIIADTTEGDFYFDAARWANDMGMIDPMSFDPNKPCTRSAAVRFICQAFAVPYQEPVSSGFTDVPDSADYAYAVAWAVEKGVTNGASDTTFEPDTVCTRGQIVTFLHRAYVEG